jgi:hypothetical protein
MCVARTATPSKSLVYVKRCRLCPSISEYASRAVFLDSPGVFRKCSRWYAVPRVSRSIQDAQCSMSMSMPMYKAKMIPVDPWALSQCGVRMAYILGVGVWRIPRPVYPVFADSSFLGRLFSQIAERGTFPCVYCMCQRCYVQDSDKRCARTIVDKFVA